MCASHGVPLLVGTRSSKDRFLEADKAVPVQFLAEPETEKVLSKFTKTLYDKPPFVDLRITRMIMQQKMRNLGYAENKLYEELAERLKQSGYADFFAGQTGQKIRRKLTASWVHKENLLRALAFLFSDSIMDHEIQTKILIKKRV